VTTYSYDVLQALAVIFPFNCCDKNIFFIKNIKMFLCVAYGQYPNIF